MLCINNLTINFCECLPLPSLTQTFPALKLILILFLLFASTFLVKSFFETCVDEEGLLSRHNQSLK